MYNNQLSYLQKPVYKHIKNQVYSRMEMK